MGSGRGDRNQQHVESYVHFLDELLQWGPVVVTGISGPSLLLLGACGTGLQWGPVVVTGISDDPRRDRRPRGASMGSGRGDRNQLTSRRPIGSASSCFNGVRSW